MDNRKTALLLPSAYRPQALDECLTSLFKTTPRHLCDTFVSLFLDDRDSMDVIQEYDIAGVVYREPEEYNLGSIYGWNVLLERHPDYPFYVVVGDDVVFREGWYDAARRAMNKMGGYGMVGLNDMHTDTNEYAAHFLVSRDFLIDHHGGVIFPPLYKSWWCDRELTDLAKFHNCYTPAKDSLVEHRNHAWGGIRHDKVYTDAELNYDNDYLTYQRLKNSGFPIEWSPILK